MGCDTWRLSQGIPNLHHITLMVVQSHLDPVSPFTCSGVCVSVHHVPPHPRLQPWGGCIARLCKHFAKSL